ncbi:MAG: hypothetical protein JWQ43_2752 [Glaciihabitans sp.]|nr:hypothetical protein [Glaciihabitans sp.]
MARAFFVFGGVAAVWLAYLLFRQSFTIGWGELWFAFVYWALLAYLVLPRLQRILTHIYVPEYFIGRARTTDGLLGDPINIALLGAEGQLHHVMTAAGWVRADDLSATSGWRIVRSTVLRRSYPAAPVSPLLLFGRLQDFAYQQQVDGSPGKRHHVRFWKCPDGWMLPGGHRADWLAAGTYDRSVGLSLFTLQVTHKIAADTDAERDHVVATAASADPAVTVTVINNFSTGYHARNGGGDAIVTDGNLPVIDLGAVQTPGVASPVLTTDSRDTRPAVTTVAAILVLARAAAAAGSVVTLLQHWDTLLAARTGGVDSGTWAVGLWALIGAIVVFALVEVAVAWQVFLGRNGARVLAMSLSCVAVVVQMVDVATGGTDLTFRSGLPGLCLDILLLLALSSEGALVYARRPRTRRKRVAGRPPAVAPGDVRSYPRIMAPQQDEVSPCPVTRGEVDHDAYAAKDSFWRELHIGSPARRALVDANILSLNDLRAADLDAVARLHGMGPKALTILRAALVA